jgi:hypothetical protein
MYVMSEHTGTHRTKDHIMTQYALTVSDTGFTGTTEFVSPNGGGKFALHLFTPEQVTVWQEGTDEQRVSTIEGILTDLMVVALLTFGTDPEVVSLYNRSLAESGIDTHAVEYLGPIL